MKFVLATHNPNKIREMGAILSQFGVEVVSPRDLGNEEYRVITEPVVRCASDSGRHGVPWRQLPEFCGCGIEQCAGGSVCLLLLWVL